MYTCIYIYIHVYKGAGDIEKGPNSTSHAPASDQVDGGVEDDELEDGEHIYDV